MYPELSFSYNWNGKLNCNCFTTIRLRNDARYQVGAKFIVKLKDVPFGIYEVKGVKVIKLAQINDWIGYLDTGYNGQETQALIREMYKNKVSDWEKQELHYLILKRA